MFTKMMVTLNAYMTSLQQNEEGQGLVEYALIIVLVAIVLMAGLSTLEGGISAVFDSIGTTLSNGA